MGSRKIFTCDKCGRDTTYGYGNEYIGINPQWPLKEYPKIRLFMSVCVDGDIEEREFCKSCFLEYLRQAHKYMEKNPFDGL